MRDVAGRLGTAATVDWAELIATVDAVIIASPGAAHAEQVLACLDAGKPVLCEKPLTLDPASALELVEAQHKLGRELIPGRLHAPVRSRVRGARWPAG